MGIALSIVISIGATVLAAAALYRQSSARGLFSAQYEKLAALATIEESHRAPSGSSSGSLPEACADSNEAAPEESMSEPPRRSWLSTLILGGVAVLFLLWFAIPSALNFLDNRAGGSVFWYKGDRLELRVSGGFFPLAAAGIQLSMRPNAGSQVLVNLEGLPEGGTATCLQLARLLNGSVCATQCTELA